MSNVQRSVLDELCRCSSATIFNAVVEAMGGTQGGIELSGKGGQPICYTDQTLQYMLPEFGTVAGYAVTMELTPMDPDAVRNPWEEYYGLLHETEGPIMAFIKDVDKQPGRGASFGDNMANVLKKLDVAGVIVEGTVRDLGGIKEAGLPIWGTGRVPGHGVFSLTSVNKIIEVAGLTVTPGEIAVADEEGCSLIPSTIDPLLILNQAERITQRETEFQNKVRKPDFNLDDYYKIIH